MEAIYAAYPRKIAKKLAVEKIRIALQSLHKEHGDENFAYLIDRTRKFAKSPAGKRGEFTPHPSTWFNQGRYMDDPKEWYIQDIPDGKKPKQEQVKLSRGTFMV